MPTVAERVVFPPSFETSTGVEENHEADLEQLARGVRQLAAVNEVADELHRRPQCAEDEDADEQDRQHAQPVRRAVDLARIAQHHADQQQPGDHRQHELRSGPQLVGQQLGQDHRDHDGGRHRPAGFADDDRGVAAIGTQIRAGRGHGRDRKPSPRARSHPFGVIQAANARR